MSSFYTQAGGADWTEKTHVGHACCDLNQEWDRPSDGDSVKNDFQPAQHYFQNHILGSLKC